MNQDDVKQCVESWLQFADKYLELLVSEVGVTSIVFLAAIGFLIYLLLSERKRTHNLNDLLIAQTTKTADALNRMALIMEVIKDRVQR